jgi:glycosyltransferase involved in cell wall biosynthesis
VDIVAQPSHREGFSLGPLEAGAMHRPVVATDIRGLRESILPGRTGLLVPLGDVPRLADALETLLADPARRETMGQEARTHVLEKYHCKDVWRGVLRVYEGLLDSAEGGSKSMI